MVLEPSFRLLFGFEFGVFTFVSGPRLKWILLLESAFRCFFTSSIWREQSYAADSIKMIQGFRIDTGL